MDFYAVLDQVLDLLRQRGRVTYNALKRQFGLDDACLQDLKDEIIVAQRLAVDEDDKILVWTGGTVAPPLPAAEATAGRVRQPDRAPLAYTPPHLTDKILAARPALEGERKQVTVFFADIKDSTKLIEGLDPEAAQQLLDPAIRLMMEAVHRFEGTVNQVLGDGIMALFGAPIAHEDHALRACYAALPPWPCRPPSGPTPTRCARRTAWCCNCASGSTPARWWCGPLAMICIHPPGRRPTPYSGGVGAGGMRE